MPNGIGEKLARPGVRRLFPFLLESELTRLRVVG